ncbi:hypothetical protein F5B19DRAFT_341367 [Rostrohypoxylon terebratum]|nr:hypothetical protein F5B19DRAFT_341367 [Rostrohypoxylon terebratum]
MSSHPQPTMPPRQFSPQQSPPNQTYQLPPNKRAKLSSNGMTLTMPSAATTPLASPQPHTPTPIPTIPTMPTMPPTTIPSTNTTTASQIPYSTAKLAPLPTTAMSSMPPGITNMGPPAITPTSSFSHDTSRQPSRPATKAAHTYDMDDMLQGTDIDLEAEAEYLNNLEATAPGQGNLYASGLNGRGAKNAPELTPEEMEAAEADRIWSENALKYAREKSQEINNSLLEPGILHKRLHDIASKQNLTLNLELKPDGGRFSGRNQNPAEFPKPEIKSYPQAQADGTIIQMHTSSVPPDAFLVDQLSLLSLATKQYLRTLLSDANQLAVTRQTTAHGIIPQEWQDVAVPLHAANGTQDDAPRTGAESAVSPHTNPLKRTADEISNGLPTPVSEASPTNYIVDAMNTTGKGARNTEEKRLRKRQKRTDKQNGEKEGADGSRAGSIAPGTPGSIAPDPGEKAPSKKESKKSTAKDATSSSSVNSTLGLFVGSKKKKYSWMTQGAGAAASGPSTPRFPGAAPGTPGSTAAASSKAQRGPLTKAGVTHLGQFREDSERGKNIQLRDWVAVLEENDLDPRSLQLAYNILDRSFKVGVENTST